MGCRTGMSGVIYSRITLRNGRAEVLSLFYVKGSSARTARCGGLCVIIVWGR